MYRMFTVKTVTKTNVPKAGQQNWSQIVVVITMVVQHVLNSLSGHIWLGALGLIIRPQIPGLPNTWLISPLPGMIIMKMTMLIMYSKYMPVNDQTVDITGCRRL